VRRIFLKQGRERSLLRFHPWIFTGAIDHVEARPALGETVEVIAADGRRLALAAYSPTSQIAARVWTFDCDAAVDAAFFRARLERASALRRALVRDGDGEGEGSAGRAERLVNAESDGLPGVIVDRYAGVLVCQFLSAGAEHWRETIVAELVSLFAPASVYERSDVEVRAREGLEPRAGLLAGAEPDELVEIREGTCRFLVDVRAGHKTGFYLDQRENRFELREYVAGREVLNGFAYTGAFGVHALAAGAARVTNVDTSADALALAERNAALNGLDAAKLENVHGDVFHVLRRYRDAGRWFDVVVLDPPKFAESKGQVDRAARGYKDINLLAFKLLRPGGVLVTFSCSGALSAELFQKIVADAAVDAGKDARIVRHLRQAPDHPTALGFPEGLYLKGLVCIA
jgi:23S rRNA (cytosine1962-C5)-methyltransferase